MHVCATICQALLFVSFVHVPGICTLAHQRFRLIKVSQKLRPQRSGQLLEILTWVLFGDGPKPQLEFYLLLHILVGFFPVAVCLLQKTSDFSLNGWETLASPTIAGNFKLQFCISPLVCFPPNCKKLPDYLSD